MKKDEIENLKEANEVKKEGSKKLIIALAGILSVILVIFIITGMSYFNRQKLIKQADALISIEKYEDGISIYDNLLSKKYSENLMSKRDRAVELNESEENLKKGLEAYEEDDINKAVRHLSKIPEDDKKRYELALEELSNIEETILIDIEQLIEDGDLDQAKDVVTSYLKVAPKSVKIKNAKDSIQAKKTEAEKQAKAQEKELNDKEISATTAAKQAEADAITAKKNADAAQRKNAETSNIANNIIGTYRSIIANKANLRDAPTLKSGIITILYRGDGVYIHDTQTESADRIWCYVSTEENGYIEYGWISYNTMNYNIQ